MGAGRRPRGANRGAVTAGVVGLCAAGSVAALTALAPAPLNLATILAVAAGIAVADLLAVDLPSRRGGGARVTLVEAALAAALLWAAPLEVVTAVALGMVVVQVVERLPAAKAAFNILQYTAAAAVAALLMAVTSSALARWETAPEPIAGAAAVAGALVFTLFNSAAVSNMIAAHDATTWRTVFARVAPAALLAAVGSGSVGLLIVVTANSAPWALVAVAAPLATLRIASRQQIAAQLQRERAVTAVNVEQRLSEAAAPSQVAAALADGAAALLSSEAAVWATSSWIGDAPAASRPCQLRAPTTVTTLGAGDVGWAGMGECLAIDAGVGTLVTRRSPDSGRAAFSSDDREWIARLGESGRVHAARVAAAAAARREQETLAAVVGGTVDGIVVTDALGKVRLCNPAMRGMADTPEGSWSDVPVADLLGEGPWQQPGVHEVTRPGGAVWRVSVAEVDAPDAFDRAQAGRQPRLFVAIAHDVTAAHKAARARDDMLAIVSHELKTPLTPIKVGATLLSRRWKSMDEPVREQMLAEITSRADHLHRLIEDLLLVAQLPGSAQNLVQMAPVDFREAVERTVETVAGMWPHHTVRVEGVETAPGRSDPNRLRQVVAHLVDNACKFSPAEAPVHVTVTTEDRPEGPVARVTVTDRGCGIPAREHERVFERFARVEDPLVMTTGGTGLGLFIVRELVAKLGGEVTLRSVVGQGTTVTVRLPMLTRVPLPPAAAEPLLPGGDVTAGIARR